MGMMLLGFFTGILMCVFMLLAHCVFWFEKRYPEEDYWHRSFRPGNRIAGQGSFHPAGDLSSSAGTVPEVEDGE